MYSYVEKGLPKHGSWWFNDNVANTLSQGSRSITLRVATHVNSTMIGKLAWSSATTVINQATRMVRMTFKDHAGNTREDDFPISSLVAKRPKKGGEGLVIAGEHTGKVVTVVSLLQKKTRYKVEAASSEGGVSSWIEDANNVTEISSY